jgi:SPP1 gp7 family putative phage head morphogenesis protein
MQNEQTTDSAAVINKELSDTVDEMVNAGNVGTAATNVSSTVINQTRNEFFFDDEVVEFIYAFKFNNFDPKAAICKKLAGKVFSTNDAEFLQYSPPLHHNCKSFLSAIAETSNNKPDIEPLPPITKEERNSITLSERIEKMINVLDNNCKGH